MALAEELGVEIGFMHSVAAGATFMRSGHLDEARDATRHAVQLSKDQPDLQARAYVLLAAVEQWSGAIPAATEAAEAAEAAARSANQDLDIAQALMMRGYVALRESPETALPLLDEAGRLGLAHLPGGTSVAAFALALAARGRARLGDGPGMAACLERAISVTTDGGSREEYGTVIASVGAGLLLLHESEAAAAVLAAAELIHAPPYLYLGMGVEKSQIDERLIERLGQDGFDAARARGEAMTDREVREYVRAILDRVADN